MKSPKQITVFGAKSMPPVTADLNKAMMAVAKLLDLDEPCTVQMSFDLINKSDKLVVSEVSSVALVRR